MKKKNCKGSRRRQFIDSRRGKSESCQETMANLLRFDPIQWAKTIPIYWKRKPPATTEAVIAQGRKHRNESYNANDDIQPNNMKNVKKTTLHRWAVNFLRHECLPYDKLRHLPKGKKAKRIIRELYGKLSKIPTNLYKTII